MSATRAVHLTQEQAEDRLAYWMQVLRLQDWDVVVKVKRRYDLDGEIQGRCNWTLTRREALISLLDPRDWDPSTCWPQDMEATLVHELLHLHFAALTEWNRWEAESPSDHAMEQMIHALSFALVKLDRREV